MSNIEAYLQARAQFENVVDESRAIANVFATAANALRDKPDRFGFSNSGGLPPEAFMSQDSVSINAEDWRSPDQIMALLARYHSAKLNMINLWNSIPQNLQSGLQQPPTPHAYTGGSRIGSGSSIVLARRRR
jgi:hypothetical protein